ncbi:MAG: MraY family glycosyltransferase [Patescibacteria group bacterium]|nr:MraY family glycosyltransferase [Patescibacteria group bacterium]
MNYYNYIFSFLLAFIFSVIFTYFIKKIAKGKKIIDRPQEAPERKVQKKPIPLLGGLAIFFSFFLTILFFKNLIITENIQPKYIWGLLAASGLIMLGGYLDDKYSLKAKYQIIWPILAILVVIASGIGVTYISNPLGGFLWLDTINVDFIKIGQTVYQFTLLADIFSFVWLLGMMYTTKFLDGLDGLLSGVTVIGSVIIFILSLSKDVSQPGTAMICAILAGSALGFLIFNWHPAKVFLGEGGSLFCGFMLGILAIISGGKIATALLIMGLPILDVIWVIIRRLLFKKGKIFSADKKHLHFRLLDVGFSHQGAVIFLYFLTLVFGSTTLFFRGFSKLISLVVLVFFMLILGLVLVFVYRKRRFS